MRARPSILVVVAMLCVLQASPAFACSMARFPTPEEGLALSEGAFVGVLVNDADFEVAGTGVDTKYSFLVEWVIKGDIGRRVDVTASKNEGSCGIGVIPKGKRIGLVVSKYQGRWGADLGDRFDADKLLAAAPEGTARNLGSLGFLQRVWIRIQTFPVRIPVVLIALLIGIFVIIMRADRRRLTGPAGSEQPAP